ncbi:MAG: hypothetical protein SWY16_11645 [Cyanobacteriota bacterium]|nr:hypothetical protein [Cyanobacteriota bacterium]
MNREPESTSSPDGMGTSADTTPNAETELGFLDLDLCASESERSADEAAAAIEQELDAAVKQSATRQSRSTQESPLENLYASLLDEERSADSLELQESQSDRLSPGDTLPIEEAANRQEPLDERAIAPSFERSAQPEETASTSPAKTQNELHPPSPTLPPATARPPLNAADSEMATPEETSEQIPEQTPEQTLEQLEEAREMDTIAALTDLIPEVALQGQNRQEETVLHTWEALQMNPEAPLTEDDYLLASADEDLLSGNEDGDESLREQEQNICLDSNTMEQLESDLHRLEDATPPSIPEETQTTEELERTPSVSELSDAEISDAELDAIFPAFVLEEEDSTAENADENADAPFSQDPPTEAKSRDSQPDKIWYLGIDFGTTGLSAVLLNRLTGALYPIYWLPSETSRSRSRIFRLPAVVYAAGEETSVGQNAYQMIAAGPEALARVREDARSTRQPTGFSIERFKSWLDLGLPWCDDDGRAQPTIDDSPDRQIPLADIQRACQTLLSAIEDGRFDNDSFTSSQSGWPSEIPIPVSPHLPVAPLPQTSVGELLDRLAGAIVNIPTEASEAYRFNLREALVRSNLVRHPEQVIFVEDAIATVLSALPSDPVFGATPGEWQVSLERAGTILAIDAGATTTEFVLVRLPERWEDLKHDCFDKHSFAYGGDALDLDIIVQLLLSREEIASAVGFNSTVPRPQPGEPDLVARVGFERWLRGLPSRPALLEAAQALKLALQERDRHSIAFESIELTVVRRDLEARVLVPFVQNVNRELNVLLARTGATVEGIDRALCTGGSASWEAIALWLRQKLPNAIVVQDVYPSQQPPGCSRVAYGLATLPLYPQAFDELPQQYNDYFLVRELLEVYPDRALDLREITTLLESRGLNVRACRPRILAILAGQLPRGLVPTTAEDTLLNRASDRHQVYRALRSEPLFYAESARTYRPNRAQFDRLRQYFQKVTLNSEQTWQEPLTLGWEIPNT